MGTLSTVRRVAWWCYTNIVTRLFLQIPKNLRLMYVHAYQSYVWNAIVSERIKMHGAEKPVVGDLVFDTSSEKGADEDPEATAELAEGEQPVEDKDAGESI